MIRLLSRGTLVGLTFALFSFLGTPVAWANLYTEDLDESLFGDLSQFDVGLNSTIDPLVNMFCAPTATYNSFTFLANKYPDKYGNTLTENGTKTALQSAQDLAGVNYMNTSRNTGTSESNWINGKVNFIQKWAPLTTTFAGMDTVGTGGQAWIQPIAPTISFLLQQIREGEDIEIGITTALGGHVLTLVGLTWNDVDGKNTFNAGDTASLRVIDPGNPNFITTLPLSPGPNPGDFMTISGGQYGGARIDAALAESPNPEPVTAVLAIMAVTALAGAATRRQHLVA